jgi:uncharacterized membrane protein YwzB
MATRFDNVVPLRPHEKAPSWGSRLLVLTSYWLVAWLFPRVQPEELINLVLLLGLAYWALINHRKHWAPYFVRYHWVQIMVLMVLLGIAFAVLGEFVRLVLTALPLVGLAMPAVLATVAKVGDALEATGMLIKLFVPMFLGLAVLFNKSPQVPVASAQARQWA